MYNEAPSILIRTLHSILDRTPPQLLADIIIVDDVSTNENMKQALTDYVSALGPKVSISIASLLSVFLPNSQLFTEPQLLIPCVTCHNVTMETMLLGTLHL